MPDQKTQRPISRCAACSYTWQQRGPTPPKKCPNCQTFAWHTPKPPAAAQAAQTNARLKRPRHFRLFIDITKPQQLAQISANLAKLQVRLAENLGKALGKLDIMAREMTRLAPNIHDPINRQDALEIVALCTYTKDAIADSQLHLRYMREDTDELQQLAEDLLSAFHDNNTPQPAESSQDNLPSTATSDPTQQPTP